MKILRHQKKSEAWFQMEEKMTPIDAIIHVEHFFFLFFYGVVVVVARTIFIDPCTLSLQSAPSHRHVPGLLFYPFFALGKKNSFSFHVLFITAPSP